jgi:hypothetical protein
MGHQAEVFFVHFCSTIVVHGTSLCFGQLVGEVHAGPMFFPNPARHPRWSSPATPPACVVFLLSSCDASFQLK